MMKKTFFLYISLLLFYTPIYAENEINIFPGQWKNVSEYDISKNETMNRFEIRNKENKLYLEEYKPSEKLKKDERDAIFLAMPLYYYQQVFPIATEVWSKDRAEELKGKSTLLFLVYMSDKGEIKEVTFFLSEKTSITSQELSLFERKLKDVKFELRNNDLEGSNYVRIYFNINFKHLLEKYYK